MVIVCAWCGTALDAPGARCPTCDASRDEAVLAEPGEVHFVDDRPVCTRHAAILTAAAMGGLNASNLRRAAAALTERPS